MKTYWKTLVLTLLVLVSFFPSRVVAAGNGVFDGQIIVGRSFALKSGETLSGDLAVVGGSVSIEQGAKVEGNIAVVGSMLRIDGEVTGDVAVVGSLANLGETAYVGGNVAVVGGSLQRAEGARVAGRVVGVVMSGAGWDGEVTILPMESPAMPTPPELLEFPSLFRSVPPISRDLWRGIPEAFVKGVGFALLAMLLMLFLAQPAERVSQTLISRPVLTGAVGLLSIVVTPLLVVIMVMTILLIPFIPIIAWALVAALLFGWISLGYGIGQRLALAFKGDWHPSFAAGLGTFLLTISVFALTNIPGVRCIGWVIPTLLAIAALGSVVLTMFGTRSYPGPAQPSTPALPPPETLASGGS